MALLRFLCAALAALVISSAGLAATTSQRSPFAQGHWWDPTRSGSGFDMFSLNGQMMIVWFTYDETGRPIWYTANGPLDTLGAQPVALMKHRWSNGRKADPVVVGSVLLTLRHAEAAELAWNINGRQGTWSIQPLLVSGVINEVDHSGHWFDPTNSGWGFSLLEQGDVLGGALFTYDAAGEPTWVAGFQRGSATVEYLAYNGACPWCTYRSPTVRTAGRISFELRGESDIAVHSTLNVAMAAGTNLDGARVVQLGRPASTRPADRQLASFDAASTLKAYLDTGMLNVPPSSPGTVFSAAPPPTPFSPTNLQESGVDEADLVKSDGRLIYTHAYVNGARQPTIRIAQVGNDGATLDVIGSVSLASGTSTAMTNAGLFVYADKLISVSGPQAAAYSVSPWTSPYGWTRGTTAIEIMATSGSALPVTRWRAQMDGIFVATRRIGSRLYVVTRFVPYIAGFSYGSTYAPTIATNRQLLASTPIDALLPRISVNGGASSPLLDATAIYAPPQGARKPMADLIVVTAIDLDALRIAQAIGIIGTPDAVYASADNLVVATSRYDVRAADGSLLPARPPFYTTDVHQIGLAPGAMSVLGSASIEGYLGSNVDASSFRFSDYQGRLRVVTSSDQIWGGANQNRLTILEPSKITSGLLKTVSYLPNALRPQTLGKPYEQLHAVRFLGDRLYAVTFKKIDPLYVVDLADIADPRIAGSVEIAGFSDYLHPLANGLVLGFGKDAKPADGFADGQFAWYQGLQLSLFNVSDAGQPRELQRVIMGKRGSDSALLRDHHAFSALMQADGTGTFAMPVRIHDGPYPQSGSGDSAYYPWLFSGLARFELRGTSAADARLVILPALVTNVASSSTTYSIDPATSTARSVLFRNGSIYVGNGQFWRQDGTGAAFGPY